MMSSENRWRKAWIDENSGKGGNGQDNPSGSDRLYLNLSSVDRECMRSTLADQR